MNVRTEFIWNWVGIDAFLGKAARSIGWALHRIHSWDTEAQLIHKYLRNLHSLQDGLKCVIWDVF